MCGIAGLYRTGQSAEQQLRCLKDMLAHVRHRGPDEMGYYFDDDVAMATARLSIVDISTGQQPINDRSGRFWIVFNGEIYNYMELRRELIDRGHQFASESDTEVLLYAWIEWGPESLRRLNGAFAFCIFDRLERSLVVARDRFGKRPFYYLQQSEGIVFASEMKCFLAYEPFRFEFDPVQLATTFRIWTPVEDCGPYREVHQLPAGAYLYIRSGTAKVSHYAPLKLDRDPLDVDESAATQQVYDALSESVRLRLRGDVEVATYLSGGIDSAIVTHLVGNHTNGKRIKSFSIGFDAGEFDETADQRLVAEHLGTAHESLQIANRDIVDAFPDALWHAEVPVFRTAFVPMFLLSRLVRGSGIKVVLTGEGADEAFLGYDIFKETLLRRTWSGLTPEQRLSQISRLYPYIRNFSEYDRTALMGLFNRLSQDPSSALFSHELRFHNSKLSERLLIRKTDASQHLALKAGAQHEEFQTLSAVQRAQWLEYKTLLGGYLLSTQGDRMTLAHSVENRCPFLDPSVVELACATNLRFNDGFDEKYLLKKAFARVLPEKILRKPKQPYRAPDASAFLCGQPDYLELIRSEHELRKIADLDVKFCSAFVAKVLAKSPSTVSQAENQAFLFLLSLAMLNGQFVERKFTPPTAIDSLLVRQIDGRTLA